MKRIHLLVGVIALGFAMMLGGCSQDTTTGPGTGATSDQQAVQQMATADSVGEFASTDETAIDDGGPLEEAFAKSSTLIKPFRWGRTIDNIVRNVDINIIGDSIAIATITRVITGQFKISASYSATATWADTIISKPYTERVQRKIRFRRVAHSTIYERNWVPVAITLVAGNTQPDSDNKFTITSIEFNFPLTADTVTDPLNTWLRFGRIQNGVPLLGVNDSAVVHLKILSSDPDTEHAVLRYRARPVFYLPLAPLEMRRVRMVLEGSVPGTVPGTYERTYKTVFYGALRAGVAIGRYNAVVDVISHGSLYDDAKPFSNRFWGVPYIVFAR